MVHRHAGKRSNPRDGIKQFRLGFEEEYWDTRLAALVIPSGERNIIVAPHENGWVVLLKGENVLCEDLLMTACIVQTELVTSQSNHGGLPTYAQTAIVQETGETETE